MNSTTTIQLTEAETDAIIADFVERFHGDGITEALGTPFDNLIEDDGEMGRTLTLSLSDGQRQTLVENYRERMGDSALLGFVDIDRERGLAVAKEA